MTTAAPATRTVSVIRSPPGSQLQRDRAFLRMSLASFMQDADAHHRRRRIRSPSVPRFPATLPRGGSSASSSDQDAGDGDYKEPSAGNTPRRRSATSSRAVSPAAPRKQAFMKSKSPASPSSSRASKQDDSDDSADELSSAPCLRVSDSNRGEQLATPNASKQAGGKRKRAPSTRYTSNRGLPSWKSDQPTGVLRAPANPMVQPQRAAPSAEPALQIIHGDNDCMQGQGLRGADNCARSCPSRASRSRWSLDREGSSDHTAVTVPWLG